MKQYSLKEIILTALIASLFTAAVLNLNFIELSAQASVFDFLNKIPILKNFYTPQEIPAVPSKNLNLKKEPEIYEAHGYEEQIINSVKNASPAVVSVVVTKNVPVIEQFYTNPFGNDPFFKQFFGDVQIPQFRQKGFEKKEIGGGTGFIISSDGLILSNKHVVADTSAEYTILTNDGKKYPAKVLARDNIVDVAIIKIKAINLTTIKLGDSDSIKVGQTAIAIGNALGEFKNTVSVGVVSGLRRSITASGGGAIQTIYDVIQTDASINPGNSGGPLLNLSGKVIGINTAMVSGAQNIGFAIPINQAKRIISDILSFGVIKTPFLGVRYITITPSTAENKKLPFDYGALIAKSENNEPAVIDNSPAAKAGLRDGDIILEINGRRIDADNPLISKINLYSVGDKINLKIWRDGKIMTIQVILAEKP